MSRYIREIDLQLPEDEVQGLIDGFLKGNGFYRDEWQGDMLDSRLWDEYGSLSIEGHRGEYQDIFF